MVSSSLIMVGQPTALARSGEITTTLAAIDCALQLDPAVEIGASVWNEVCWRGTLAGLVFRVLTACHNAVTGAPENGYFHDSRGLALALTGKIDEAIDDLEFTVQWAKAVGYGEAFIVSRQRYIDALKAGRNPFTPTELARLRNE